MEMHDCARETPLSDHGKLGGRDETRWPWDNGPRVMTRIVSAIGTDRVTVCVTRQQRAGRHIERLTKRHQP